MGRLLVVRSTAVFVLLLLSITLARSATFYVRPDGSDESSGSSWTTAFKTIQVGLDTAQAGDEVWVAAGIYKECITLKPSVALYGGFAGSEEQREQRNPVANVTSIGYFDPSGWYITYTSGPKVTIIDCDTAGTIIDGFTITGGESQYGGGILCKNSSATISNNIIKDCAAEKCGGGIYCSGGAPTLINNTIEGNGIQWSTDSWSGWGYAKTASWEYTVPVRPTGCCGGGIYCDNSNAVVTGNKIIGNIATFQDDRSDGGHKGGWGGGIYCLGGSPVISDNLFKHNGTGVKGGAIFCDNTTALIENNQITENTAYCEVYRCGTEGNGGGIYCYQGTLVITGNNISNNTTFYGGGGIFCENSSASIIRNQIISNKTDTPICITNYDYYDYPNYGGGIRCTGGTLRISGNIVRGNTAGNGGGISCSSVISAVITGNEVSANIGGGIFCEKSSGSVVNNTSAGNSLYGVLCVDCSSARLANNIIAYNYVGLGCAGTAVVESKNNCLYGNDAGNYINAIPGDGDIEKDPGFANWRYAQVRIGPDSACRNAGDNSSACDDLDIAENPRIGGGVVDIGAYESDDTTPECKAKTVMVSPYGSDDNDGSSWDKAFSTIEAATWALRETGGEVWVRHDAIENYYSTPYYCSGITVYPGVHIYGGFSGSETNLDERVLSSLTNVWRIDIRSVFTPSTVDGFRVRGGQTKYGGGICCFHSSSEIAHCLITGNGVDTDRFSTGLGTDMGWGPRPRRYWWTSGLGGGIYCEKGNLRIHDNVIAGNCASSGGAVYSKDSKVTITDNTLVGNTANEGGAITINNSQATVSNNIMAFGSSGVYFGSGSVDLHNNCLYGNKGDDYSGVSPSPDDIFSDPMLVSIKYGDFRIQPGSPCKDAGCSEGSTPSEIDVFGQERVRNGRVDIGACESDGTLYTPADPIIVRVSPDGSDENDGLSWGKAKKSIGKAISEVSLHGGEVWVRSGEYSERINVLPHVFVYGGFNGTENERWQRNWKVNKTSVRGADIIGGSDWTSVDGFFMSGAQRAYGGGVYCVGSSASICNNTITGNSVENYNEYYDDLSGCGGGIYCYMGSPVIKGNVIANNSAYDFGGGICLVHSDATFINNEICDNDQGALYCWAGKTAFINNTVAGNREGDVDLHSASVVLNNIIAFNDYIDINNQSDIHNNCVFGNTDYGYDTYYSAQIKLLATEGIATDPLFVDRAAGNYHLKPNSPCINAGSSVDLHDMPFDLDKEGRICGRSIDIGVDELWPTNLSIHDAKNAADGAVISGNDSVVSAVWHDFFYVESPNRSSGIRIDKKMHGVNPGQMVSLSGTITTDPSGERCIAADSVTPEGEGKVAPVTMSGQSIGGGKIGLQGAIWSFRLIKNLDGSSGWVDQENIGLSTIGLLIKTCGRVTLIDTDNQFFYVDDGSAMTDGTVTDGKLNSGIRVYGDASSICKGQFIIVSGISSCFTDESGKLRRMIRLAK